VVTLQNSQMPTHSHPMIAGDAQGTLPDPGGNILARSHTQNVFLYRQGNPDQPMANAVEQYPGGFQPHDNMQPYLVIAFIISLFGVFPSQT
jgi:microcystin-dependent protein